MSNRTHLDPPVVRSAGRMATVTLVALGLILPASLAVGAGQAEAQSRSRKMVKTLPKSQRTPRRSRARRSTEPKRRRTHKKTRKTKRAKQETPYFSVGVGMVDHGGAANAVSQSDFAIQPMIGFKFSKQLSLEAGILGFFADSVDQNTTGGVTDPSNTNSSGSQGLTLGGLNGAVKYVLPASKRLLPYGLAGLGFYTLGSQNEDLRPAVDFGLGTDYRVDRDINVGARWVYTGYWLDATGSADDPDSSWSMLATVSMRF